VFCKQGQNGEFADNFKLKPRAVSTQPDSGAKRTREGARKSPAAWKRDAREMSRLGWIHYARNTFPRGADFRARSTMSDRKDRLLEQVEACLVLKVGMPSFIAYFPFCD